jgi:HUS1 checkpoint protein
MRFKASIQNINTFTSSFLPVWFWQSGLTRVELTASLNSLGPLAWVKLSDDQVCFTIIPEQGTQVWA